MNNLLKIEINFNAVHQEARYSGNLNNELVQYSNGPKLFDC